MLVRHVPARELPFLGVIGFRQWRKAYISDAKCRRVALRAPPPRRTHSPYSLAFRRQPAKSHLADLLTSPYSQRAPSTSTLIVWPGRTRCRHHCHTKTTAARPERVMLSPGRRSNPSRLVNHSATPSSRTLLHAQVWSSRSTAVLEPVLQHSASSPPWTFYPIVFKLTYSAAASLQPLQINPRRPWMRAARPIHRWMPTAHH